jgi:GMP synthase-like glutamine amidotransferase
MRIQVLQHVPFEGLGSISPWATEKGYAVRTCGLFRDDPLPDPEQFDWLIVLGGPMGVYDEARHPWLVDEKRLIEAALRAEKTVLGICLGAQLIATVLGKKVTRNQQREIGWFPLKLTQAALLFTGTAIPSRFLTERFTWRAAPPASTRPISTASACWHFNFISKPPLW